MADFFVDLYPKVNELREAFRARYAGEHGYLVREDGSVAVPAELESFKPEMDAFFFDVYMLANRFMQYSDLDPTPYKVRLNAMGVDKNVGEGPSPSDIFGIFDRMVGLEYMVKVLDLIDGEEWRGNAATDFENLFLLRFFHTHAAQRQALFELAVLLAAYHEGEKRAKQDLLSILNNAINALAYSTVSMDGFAVLSVITSAVGMVVLPELAVPAMVAYGMNAVSIGAGFVSTLQNAQDPRARTDNYPISGDDALEILVNVAAALDAMEEAMDANDRELKSKLEQLLTSPESLGNPLLVLPVPPIVA